MTHIVSVMQLEGVEIKGLEKFIAHWRKIKDMPCEDMGIETLGERNLQLKLYYPLDIFDKSVTQFITILFGELTLIASFGRARFVDLQLPNAVYKWFGGPKFGAEKLKTRFGVEEWPLLFAIINPSLGKELSSAKVKEKIESVLNSGFHAIKDDEMQGDLKYAPLKEKIKFAKKYWGYAPVLNIDNNIEYKNILGAKRHKKLE